MARLLSLIRRLKPRSGWQWLVLISVLIASFLRLYNVTESTMFLGDQGRDALIVSRVFTDRDLVFIGPVTSVGNMYLGPFYYYFMLPFLLLSYPSPVGPSVAVAVAGIAFVFLLYYWGRSIIGERAAAIASFLAAVSVVLVDHSRFSWNPNIVPVVSLGLFVSVYHAWKGKSWYWVGAAVAVSILVQLHYVTLLAVAAAGLIWLVDAFRQYSAQRLQKFLGVSVVALVVVALSFAPLVLFDIKHDGLNRKALQTLFVSEKAFSTADAETLSSSRFMTQLEAQAEHVLFSMYTGIEQRANPALGMLVAIWAVWFITTVRTHPKRAGVIILIFSTALSIVGISFYQRTVYDHYILFTSPIVLLLLGFILAQLWRKTGGAALVVVILLLAFLCNQPLYTFVQRGTPFTTLQATAEQIHQKIQPGQSYAIVLLTPSKDLYGMNFRYFLSLDHDKQPVSPEFSASADKLFIIDEEKNLAEPEKQPIYELVTYPGKTVTEKFEVPNGPTVYILEKPPETISE